MASMALGQFVELLCVEWQRLAMASGAPFAAMT